MLGYSKAQQVGKRFKPKMGQRTQITKKEAEKAKEVFGAYCYFCGDTEIELHHIVYAKQLGKGKWRNLIGLCNEHHRLVHAEPTKAVGFRNKREGKYGEHYWCDEYDLFKMGLIDNPTEAEFERYMKAHEFPF